MTTEEGSGAGGAPKTPKTPKPEIPVVPSIATAALIVRAAVSGVLGLAPDQYSMSVLQRTYLKPGEENTAKVSMTCGKKGGNGLLKLDDCDAQTLLLALEQAANQLIQDDLSFQALELTKGQLPFPITSVGDASHEKIKNESLLLTLVRLSGHLVALSDPPLPSTGLLQSVTFDLKQCSIKATPKQAQVTLKFRVTAAGDDGETAVPVQAYSSPDSLQPFADAMMQLKEPCIRFSIGQELLEKKRQQQQQQQAQEQAQKENAALLEQTRLDAAEELAKQQQEEEEEMVVNVETVTGKIDYNRLVEQFGSSLLNPTLLQRLQALSKIPLHRFLRRNIFFSHRDLDTLVTQLEKGQPLYLYTGRGPSSESMHLGHLIPFLFTKWCQEAFDAPLVIQMTDDEKFIFKGNYDEHTGDNLLDFQRLTYVNAKDIIACGFHQKKTFIFSDLDYVGTMYPNIVRIWKAVTTNTVNGIFGFDGSANSGKIAFPAIQAAPSFASSFPKVLKADRDSPFLCLIPCAIDQDPYFRMTRDVAHKLVNKKHPLGGKPALIHSKFFPPLQGAKGKMSSSDTNSAIFLTDTPEEISRKIKEHAFSGGRETKAQQQELGADLDVDVSYQWLKFFLEDDDELDKIGQDYGSGSGEFWSTSKIKDRLIQILQELVAQHQERRSHLTNEEVRSWMEVRSIL